MKEYQIESSKFCGYIKVDDNDVIIETMPILRKFVEQSLANLVYWTNKNFKYCRLTELRKRK